MPPAALSSTSRASAGGVPTRAPRRSAVRVAAARDAAADAGGAVPAAAAPPATRRSVLAATGLALAAGLAAPRTAGAFIEAPPGFRLHEDRLDGYYFFYPDDWLPVTTSGNDAFYRSPRDVDENLFVNVSSPSSSRYASVSDLGSPADAAAALLQTYTAELMSTRLGVRREGSVVSAAQRTGPDGRLYYDIALRQRSVASRQQLAVSGQDVTAGLEVEWDRVYRAVLGVANKRLYEFRLQAPAAAWEAEQAGLEGIAASFRCKTVDV